MPKRTRPNVDEIDRWLPQTQCTQCGYPRCLDYAAALRDGDSDINRCPPGGEVTIRGLAVLLGVAPKPLDPACGEHLPRRLAVIDEALCIGCRLCIDACPVDAIVGAPKHMHSVIADQCTGCELCLAPCPVDCIDMRTPAAAPQSETTWPGYPSALVERARRQTAARLRRLGARQQARRLRQEHRQLARPGGRAALKRRIADAVARARGKTRGE